MAKVIGLLNVQKKVPKIIQDKNSSSCTFSVNKTGENVTGVTLDGAGKDGKGIEIARNYDYLIWNLVSISSFQYVLIDCDFVMEEMVGKERTKNSEVIPFDPSVLHLHYSPDRLTRKRINSNVFYSCFIRFADTRGRFNGAKISCELKIRKRPLT